MIVPASAAVLCIIIIVIVVTIIKRTPLATDIPRSHPHAL